MFFVGGVYDDNIVFYDNSIKKVHFKESFMSVIKKKIIMLLISCSFFTSLFYMSVSASESSHLISTVAEYNLVEGGTQEFVITDNSGEHIEVTIIELPANSRIDNGSYKVEFSKPLIWKAGFYVAISSNKITSAYSPYHNVYIGSILSPSLVRDSSIQASYHFTYKQGISYINTGIRAKISGTTLDVSMI